MSNSKYFSLPYRNQLVQDRFGVKVAAQLSDAADALPHDISERLRAARMQALGARKVTTGQTARSVVGNGPTVSLTFGDEDVSLWNRIAATIPLIALMVGLVAIYVVQDDSRTRELADVDSALLTDDLPPAAFTDPGFAQFLKLSQGQDQQ
jgi:hypothetical protein